MKGRTQHGHCPGIVKGWLGEGNLPAEELCPDQRVCGEGGEQHAEAAREPVHLPVQEQGQK